MYRSHYHSIELQLELTRRGIPYRVQSGVRFFEQAHIKDVVSYLRIVVNPRDEIAWKRVLKMIPGIGKATANRVYERIIHQYGAADDAEARGLARAVSDSSDTSTTLSVPPSLTVGLPQHNFKSPVCSATAGCGRIERPGRPCR